MAELEPRSPALSDWQSGRPRRLLLRVPEAAQMCALGKTKAWELVASGAWPSISIGRSVRVPLDGLLTWLEEQLDEQG